jgi:hypothetical protein
MTDQRLTPQEEAVIREQAAKTHIVQVGSELPQHQAAELPANYIPKLLAEIDRLQGEKDAAVIAERERVLGLMQTHAAKYLAGQDQWRFKEVIDWLSTDARAAAPDATVPPPCTPTKSAP